jgi:hypothetical protein
VVVENDCEDLFASGSARTTGSSSASRFVGQHWIAYALRFRCTAASTLRTGIMGGAPCPAEVMNQLQPE